MKFNAFMSLTVVFLLVSFAINTAFAQSELGRISGSVTDINGAVVPGASVAAQNQSTGESRTAVAGDDGSFAITNLRPGKYTLTVVAGDFQTATRSDVD